MKNRLIFLPVLASLLVLGLLVGLQTSTVASADPPAGTTATGTTVTDPGTTSAGGTTTASTTGPGTTVTYPGTTVTGPGTTTAGATTTTTGGSGNGNGSSVNNSSAGSNVSNATTQPPITDATTQSSPAQTTPTAPCATSLTCGNNASTELAIVNQQCSTSSANTIININVQTLGGNPVNNLTISPTTSCLNELAITQIVEQYCVSCTVIVVPPPPPPPAVVYVPQIVQQVQNVTSPPTIVQPVVKVEAFCLPRPVVEPDGTIGALVYVDISQPLPSADGGAVPASYRPGVGMFCPQATARLTSFRVPMFTLTVPASFANQFVRLCVQPGASARKTVCREIRINDGATISVPVTSNVIAKVINAPKTPPAKTKKQIQKASSSLFLAFGNPKTKAAGAITQGAKYYITSKKTRKGPHR